MEGAVKRNRRMLMSTSIEMATSDEDNMATVQVFILTGHWQFIQWHAFCQSRESSLAVIYEMQVCRLIPEKSYCCLMLLSAEELYKWKG